jgi:hypothetical protein
VEVTVVLSTRGKGTGSGQGEEIGSKHRVEAGLGKTIVVDKARLAVVIFGNPAFMTRGGHWIVGGHDDRFLFQKRFLALCI